MKDYIPFPAFYDDMPIDISYIFESEKPAGKHGFLKTDGDRFAFEDGTVARFWGVNINGAANFPEFSYSEKFAKRLAKTGINLVRLHQLDAEWNTPNIFAFTKGKRLDNTMSFNSESIKRLDYLIYCLKNEGIYCYMDMFTYRKFKSGDGVLNAASLFDAAKPECMFDERIIELQKKLAKDLWEHVNPHTGLAYKDEPAIVLAEIVNECDLFTCHEPSWEISSEPYVTKFRKLFKNWITENNIQYDWENCEINGNNDEAVISFKIYLQQKYYSEMLNHLRKIGVKIPITGNNWISSPANIYTQLTTDFFDSHTYFYDWNWGEFEKKCMNRCISGEKVSPLMQMSQCRTANRPLFVSEWDMPWPNEFRAESPLYYAAVGLLQGWSGFAVHTYSYTSKLDRVNILGKEASCSKIGGTPYREGIFSVWNDPAKYGLFYHAALMTRRGDVAPARESYAVKPISNSQWSDEPFRLSIEKSKISTTFSDSDLNGSKIISESICNLSGGEILSDTGQLYRNPGKGYGKIDTDMTKCAYGLLGKNGDIKLSGVKINCETDFATIALSSLTNEKITSSDNILLTAVGRAENTGAEFIGELMTQYGTAPITIEVIKANIEIETDVDMLSVWAVSAEGLYIGKVPSKYEDGVFKFEIGSISKSMYYLIVKE